MKIEPGEIKEAGPLESIFREAYEKIFSRSWPVWLGGLLIGLLSIIIFAWARPLGVIAGPREWVDWLFYSAGLYGTHPQNPLISSGSALTFALIWGAFASALFSRQFAIKVPPPFEMVRSAAGGVMMGIGAAMAAGCNVGGFFSATSALSLGGLAMMTGLLVGVYLEVHYFYWELEHFRFKRGEGRPRRRREGAPDLKKRQPWLGALSLAAALVAVYAYRSKGLDPATGASYRQIGGVLICGLFFGIILHRSRFAFLQAFREPFISGNGAQAKGMAIAVIVSVIGFAVLKSSGLRPAGIYVEPTFWAGSFIGGIIFGFGMPFAGGCASGVCWRAAEGSVKVLIALVFMAFSNSLLQAFFSSHPGLPALMGRAIFLPAYISYFWSVALVVMIMLLYYLAAAWNEKTKALI